MGQGSHRPSTELPEIQLPQCGAQVDDGKGREEWGGCYVGPIAKPSSRREELT